MHRRLPVVRKKSCKQGVAGTWRTGWPRLRMLPAMSVTRTDAPPLAELDEIQRRVLWLATRMIDYANRERPDRGPPQGRRPPGLVGLGRDRDDGALLPLAARRRPRVGQAARLAGAARRSTTCSVGSTARTSADAARLRRPAGLPQPHEGSRPDRLLHRLGRPRRRGAAVRGRRRPLRSRALRPRQRPAVRRADRRRRAGRGQRVGGHRRPVVPRPRQRHLDRRLQPPVARPRDPGHPLRRARERVPPSTAGTSRRSSTARSLRAAYELPGGDTLRRRIDDMPNPEYQSLLRRPASQLRVAGRGRRPRGESRQPWSACSRDYSDEELPDLIGDLAGPRPGRRARRARPLRRRASAP